MIAAGAFQAADPVSIRAADETSYRVSSIVHDNDVDCRWHFNHQYCACQLLFAAVQKWAFAPGQLACICH